MSELASPCHLSVLLSTFLRWSKRKSLIGGNPRVPRDDDGSLRNLRGNDPTLWQRHTASISEGQVKWQQASTCQSDKVAVEGKARTTLTQRLAVELEF
ncbi:hypothetical protein EYF80_035043 [Liparis tanakae]|uniref:Uncharacterized protein n=1 Tax=Liparis tanakae TaxID=230148 RepID=A0A4Z2GNH4_9TELE|nr:hypothetical protein EYF80_035043 [Liparis tanakae]